MAYHIMVTGDFSASHLLKGEGLHGHNFDVCVKLYGDLNEEFMVMDFADLKDALDEICDKLDHKVLLPSKYAITSTSTKSVELQNDDDKYIFPEVDVMIMPIESITTELLARYIHSQLKEKLKITNKDGKISVSLSEKKGYSATYI